jgi:hypothetical protein
LEFGVYFSVDAGSRWVELRGGIPRMAARDLHIQRQWTDLVVGTFGRGIYILDDYSALRDINAETLAAEAWLFPLRPAPLFNELGQVRAAWGDKSEPNPPFGATLTYHLREPMAKSAQLVLTISDESGKQVRRLELPGEDGIHRVTWDLRHDPPPATPEAERSRRWRGQRRGEIVSPGRYTATLGHLTGESITDLGKPQIILVVPLQR